MNLDELKFGKIVQKYFVDNEYTNEKNLNTFFITDDFLNNKHSLFVIDINYLKIDYKILNSAGFIQVTYWLTQTISKLANYYSYHDRHRLKTILIGAKPTISPVRMCCIFNTNEKFQYIKKCEFQYIETTSPFTGSTTRKQVIEIGETIYKVSVEKMKF